MYHFMLAATGAGACSPWAGLCWSTIDELRHLGPDEIEEAEHDRGEDRHADHDDGRGADLLRGRPRDLLQLGSDLGGHAVHAIVLVEDDAGRQRAGERDERGDELVRRADEVAPDPVDGPREEVEENDPPAEVHQVDWLVRSVVVLSHGGPWSATRMGRGDRT